MSKQLPLSRYTIREVKAPEHYGVNETELTATWSMRARSSRLSDDKSWIATERVHRQDLPARSMDGQPVRYTFSGIANTSNVRLDSFCC
ncbi:MAG: hypothetical protein ACLRWQ_08960 [Flavonifractor plautii]